MAYVYEFALNIDATGMPISSTYIHVWPICASNLSLSSLPTMLVPVREFGGLPRKKSYIVWDKQLKWEGKDELVLSVDICFVWSTGIIRR